ncbi:MAG: ATP-binding cassette domain-containing protein, partial [Bacteriovoracaceae bacterium]
MSLSIKQSNAFQVNSRPVSVDFFAKEGVLNFLTGPNGAGKTTFFTYLKTHRNFYQGFEATFMDQAAFNPLTDMRVKDALAVVEEEVPGARPWQEIEAARNLEIEKLLHKNSRHLSGGENQKLKLVLALMRPFDLFFGDEPLQNLDQKNQSLVYSLFEQ